MTILPKMEVHEAAKTLNLALYSASVWLPYLNVCNLRAFIRLSSPK